MNGSSAAEGFAQVPERVEQLSHRVIGAALKVHKELGPGLIESIYERCLCYEFQKSGLEFERQVAVPVVYDSVKLDADLRLDIWVEQLLIVEVKAVEAILPIHQAQLMTYLKLTGNRLGLLINFNVALLKNGIKRVIL
ncbi:MAG: GxxExxY protein [Pyrinomonadaceae bacterium]|nr:GxxExxY protein [Pyrinomonadaceae bacterium]